MFPVFEIKHRVELTWDDLAYIECPAFARTHTFEAVAGRADPWGAQVVNIDEFKSNHALHCGDDNYNPAVEQRLSFLFSTGNYFSVARNQIPFAANFKWRPLNDHPDGGEWYIWHYQYGDHVKHKLEAYAKHLGEKRRRMLAEAAEDTASAATLIPAVRRVAEKAVAEKLKSTLNERKGIPPQSLDDASIRLEMMKDEIATHGHKPKYTDQELLQQAKTGEVVKERYHVRFMEIGHQWDKDDAVKDSQNLTGKLGREFAGATGTGPRHWSTTFDQIEDADTDAMLICQKLGIDYESDKKYMLVVIDTEKSNPLTGCEAVSATFNNISEFANRELPRKFPKEFTDQVMTVKYQADYKMHYEVALKNKFLKDRWSTDTVGFSNYLNTTTLSGSEKNILVKRMEMHKQIGNNQHYLGNGVTKNNIAKSPNAFGAVETHNFERTSTNLQKLKDQKTIKIMYL